MTDEIKKVIGIFYTRYGKDLRSCTPTDIEPRHKMYRLLNNYFKICEEKNKCTQGNPCRDPTLKADCAYFQGREETALRYERPKKAPADQRLSSLEQQVREFQARRKQEERLARVELSELKKALQ